MKKYLKNMFINIKETFDETYGKISEDGLLLGQKRFVAAVKSDEQHTEGGTITTYKNGDIVEDLCYVPVNRKSNDSFPEYFGR